MLVLPLVPHLLLAGHPIFSPPPKNNNRHKVIKSFYYYFFLTISKYTAGTKTSSAGH
jgi:hypothetical protein